MKATIYELQSAMTLVLKENELSEGSLESHSVLAETQYSTVSPGTEVAAWRGDPPLRPSVKYPRLVGYCNIARVKKVGDQVKDISPGDWILTHQSHRSAFICNDVDVLHTFGSATPDKDLKLLCTAYLFHLGYAALLAGSFQPGHEVAIVGMGTLGLATTELLSAFGNVPSLFTEQSHSIQTDRENGHARIFKKKPGSIEWKAHLGDLNGFDIVINTSNLWSDHNLALEIARKGGTIVCLGFPGRGQPPPVENPLKPEFFYDKQLTIRHCGYVAESALDPIDARFTLKRNIRFLCQLIRSGALNPNVFLTQESDWRDLEKVYSETAARQRLSTLLRWNP